MLLQLLCQSIMHLPKHHQNMDENEAIQHALQENENRVDAKIGSVLDFPSPQVRVQFVPFKNFKAGNRTA